MDPGRDPLADLVRQTMAQPAQQREAWLRSRCAREPALADLVLKLVQEQETRTLVEQPAEAAAPQDLKPPVPSVASQSGAVASSHPVRFGPYRVLDTLGEGGMGMVYLAEQERPRRTVALKVIRPGLLTPRLLRRFELESQTLARLQHPGISQIYDAGTFKDPSLGEHPYFAMEYIRGEPLNEYARTHRLDIPARIRLFIHVCEAVQHAHQRGVIHRDLKSANIVVTAEGVPKVLDFGVAKLTDQAGEQDHGHTLVGQVVGTVPYMSPEQIAGRGTDVDTRSDVYTLGVVLYELLSGRVPHAVQGRTLVEASHIIASQDAPRLGSLSGEFRGDLETIAAKAVEREKERRYQSPAELAADLGRYLADEPIVARPSSRVYQLRKFARRNRPLVALGAAAVLILAAGVAGVVWQAFEATYGRNLAEKMRVAAEIAKGRAVQEAAIAKQINALLSNMLISADPDESMGREVTVKEALDRTAKDLDQQVSDPRVLASLHSTLSSTYQNLGRLAEAEQHARRAAQLLAAEYGDDHAETLAALRQLGNTITDQARFPEAREILQKAAEASQARDQGSVSELSISIRLDLGRNLRESGEMELAERELSAAGADAEQVLGSEHPVTLYAVHNMASLRKDQGRFEEAIAMFTRLIDIRTRINGPLHTQTLAAMNNLAATLQRAGKNEESLAILDKLYEARSGTLGSEHPSTLTTLANRGVALVALKRLSEAEPVLRRVVEGYKKVAGGDHNKTLVAMGNLAFALEDLGRDAEAEQIYREVLDIRSRTSSPNLVESLSITNNLAMLIQRQGRPVEAAELFRDLVARSEKAFPAGHYAAAAFKNNYGACLTELGRLDEAQPLLTQSFEDLRKTFPENHPRVVKARQRLEALRTKMESPAGQSKPGASVQPPG